MLFFYLENQLFLLISVIFSAYFIINALVVKFQPLKTRAFGLNFVIPLFFNIAAFLAAPYDKSHALNLLFLGHILLTVFCTSTLLFKEGEGLKIYYMFPFLVTGVAYFNANLLEYSSKLVLFIIVITAVLLTNAFMIFYCFYNKKKYYCIAYFGLFMISAALGVWLLTDTITAETVFLTGAGFLLCSVFVYQNSLGQLFREYSKNVDDLRRMNFSIQSEVIKRVNEIERSNRRLLEKSKKDSLTDLYSNSAITGSLEAILKRTPHYMLSVIMMDIDDFKNINDTMGHRAGDRCIKMVANLAKSSFRQDDVIGRYGGDEFLVILPSTPSARAFTIAEQFRRLVQTNTSPKLTVSVGISSYPDDGKTASELIEAADRALYKSKEKGKNSITLYSEIKSQP